MTESQIPVAGSLSAKVIRACTIHRICPLTCRERKVEDLGEIASFEAQDGDVQPASLIQRLREGFRRWLY